MFMSQYTVYEPPLLVISIQSSAYTNFRIYKAPLHLNSFHFTKPNLFVKNIGRYMATSTYIHLRVPFKFSLVFDTFSSNSWLSIKNLSEPSPN
jgi:hypothetical protein